MPMATKNFGTFQSSRLRQLGKKWSIERAGGENQTPGDESCGNGENSGDHRGTRPRRAARTHERKGENRGDGEIGAAEPLVVDRPCARYQTNCCEIAIADSANPFATIAYIAPPC